METFMSRKGKELERTRESMVIGTFFTEDFERRGITLFLGAEGSLEVSLAILRSRGMCSQVVPVACKRSTFPQTFMSGTLASVLTVSRATEYEDTTLAAAGETVPGGAVRWMSRAICAILRSVEDWLS
jgi:hypothetical protein